MAMVEGPLRLPSLPVFFGDGVEEGEGAGDGEMDGEDEVSGERV